LHSREQRQIVWVFARDLLVPFGGSPSSAQKVANEAWRNLALWNSLDVEVSFACSFHKHFILDAFGDSLQFSSEFPQLILEPFFALASW
jgi:hypothetical protein